MIKRRYANREPWPRILKRRFTVEFIDEPDYVGHVTLLCIDQVTEPLWIKHSRKPFCIVADGYSWLQQFPSNTHYAVTTQFDEQNQHVQWYIDICLQHGVDEFGIPWWDDLFLDVIVWPNGDCFIDDADELDAALESGAIDEAQHQLAWAEATKIVRLIEQDEFPLLELGVRQHDVLLATL